MDILGRHYLSFMGGSDVQQVAYAVTLLRANPRMSGTLDTKGDIGIRPEIGLNCVICCWSVSDQISVRKKHNPR